MSARSCRTCIFLNVPPNAAGKIVARKHSVYPCTAAVEQPMLPACMTKVYGFRWPISRSHMGPDEGQECYFYKARPKQPSTPDGAKR
jgi:hypothetical protein